MQYYVHTVEPPTRARAGNVFYTEVSLFWLKAHKSIYIRVDFVWEVSLIMRVIIQKCSAVIKTRMCVHLEGEGSGEQGSVFLATPPDVRVGPEVITDPAFLVTR